MNTDEKETADAPTNFVQIKTATHVVFTRGRALEAAGARTLIVFCSRASTSRKFSPPTRPVPFSLSLSLPASTKFAGKSSRPPCIHSRRPVYVTVGAVQEPPPITPIPRRPCFIVYERPCFIHPRVKVISEVPTTAANLAGGVISPIRWPVFPRWLAGCRHRRPRYLNFYVFVADDRVCTRNGIWSIQDDGRTLQRSQPPCGPSIARLLRRCAS